MATSTYGPCLARLKVHEGGYTNDPRDPGGPTNFGVTIFDFRKYVNPKATAEDVKAMTWAQAQIIYRARYWDALQCDRLPAGVDDSVFDYGVNSGIGRAGRVLRQVLGLPTNDWHVTDEVIAAALKGDAKTEIVGIDDERLRFLHSLKTWDHFGPGWGKRVAEVKQFSLQLAAGPSLVPTPDANVQQAGKGMVASPELHDVVREDEIRKLQQALKDGGLDPGPIDGLLGTKTVRAFQTAQKIQVDGQVGSQTKPLLEAALASM